MESRSGSRAKMADVTRTRRRTPLRKTTSTVRLLPRSRHSLLFPLNDLALRPDELPALPSSLAFSSQHKRSPNQAMRRMRRKPPQTSRTMSTQSTPSPKSSNQRHLKSPKRSLHPTRPQRLVSHQPLPRPPPEPLVARSWSPRRLQPSVQADVVLSTVGVALRLALHTVISARLKAVYLVKLHLSDTVLSLHSTTCVEEESPICSQLVSTRSPSLLGTC